MRQIFLLLFSLQILLGLDVYAQTQISNFAGKASIDARTLYDNIIVDGDVIHYVNVERGIGAFSAHMSSVTVHSLQNEVLTETSHSILRKEGSRVPSIWSYDAENEIYDKDKLYVTYNFTVITIDMETGEEQEFKIPSPYFIPSRNTIFQFIKVKENVIYAEVYDPNGIPKIVRIDEESGDVDILPITSNGFEPIEIRAGFNYLLSDDLSQIVQYDYFSGEMLTIYKGAPIEYHHFNRTNTLNQLRLINSDQELISIDLNTGDREMFCNDVEGEALSFSAGDNFLLVDRLKDGKHILEYFELPFCDQAKSVLEYTPDFDVNTSYHHFTGQQKEFAYVLVDAFQAYVLNEAGEFTNIEIAYNPSLFKFGSFRINNRVHKYMLDEYNDGGLLWGIDLENGELFLDDEPYNKFPKSDPMKIVYYDLEDEYYSASINLVDGVVLYRYSNSFDLIETYQVQKPYQLAAVQSIYNKNDTSIYLVNDSLFIVKKRQVRFIDHANTEEILLEQGKLIWLEEEEDNFILNEYTISTGTKRIIDIDNSPNIGYDVELLDNEFIISVPWETLYLDREELEFILLEGMENVKQYGDFLVSIDRVEDRLELRRYDLKSKDQKEIISITEISNQHQLGSLKNTLFLSLHDLDNSPKVYSIDLETDEIRTKKFGKDLYLSQSDILFKDDEERLIFKYKDQIENTLNIISLQEDTIQLTTFSNFINDGFGVTINRIKDYYLLNDRNQSEFVFALDKKWELEDLSDYLTPGFLRSVYYLKAEQLILAISSSRVNETHLDFVDIETFEMVDQDLLFGYTAPANTSEAFVTIDTNLIFTLDSDYDGVELIEYDRVTKEILLNFEVQEGAYSSNPDNYVVIDSVLHFDATGLPYGNQIYFVEGVLGNTSSYTIPIIEEEEEEEESISIGILYPNPTREYFMIDFDMKDVEIFDTAGKKVGIGRILANSPHYVGNFVAGTYFLIGNRNDGKNVSLKFIIQ